MIIFGVLWKIFHGAAEVTHTRSCTKTICGCSKERESALFVIAAAILLAYAYKLQGSIFFGFLRLIAAQAPGHPMPDQAPPPGFYQQLLTEGLEHLHGGSPFTPTPPSGAGE
jgi:hypothetical protein